MRGATASISPTRMPVQFQSTLLMRGATPLHWQGILVHLVFQSTLLMRGATFSNSIPSSGDRFQSTLLMRGATLREYRKAYTSLFQSTLLMRGATAPAQYDNYAFGISIHAPHARSDPSRAVRACLKSSFQSTLLMRGATCVQTHWTLCSSNFNPRSSCEERRVLPVIEQDHDEFQSTLLMRGATCNIFNHGVQIGISIHAPHARSDVHYMMLEANYSIFQSTLLMRGATTFASFAFVHPLDDFNPRSSCEERRCTKYQLAADSYISIHAPHARSDAAGVMALMCSALFQSTLLMRGATAVGWHAGILLQISIHAPHARSDIVYDGGRSWLDEFQSTLLMRGATRHCCISSRSTSRFQSTLLMRGATAYAAKSGGTGRFQSTLFMRGATGRWRRSSGHRRFQSTLLMRGATCTKYQLAADSYISIHAPHARSDGRGSRAPYARLPISIHAPHARSDAADNVDGIYASISIHAPHARSDYCLGLVSSGRYYFNPRSSCEERQAD